MKMVINSPNGLIKIGKSTGMEEVKNYSLEGKKLTEETKGSITEKKNVLEDEVKNAYDIVGTPSIKPFKIVADPANAMGSTYLEALFKTLPCELVRMNFDLDGSFPAHQPNPLIKENVVDLQERVVKEHAHLGLAPDGDGDRLFFVDEKGEIVPASLITALVAREMLKTHPGAMILYDIRYTMTPKKIIEENGGKSDITKVGHAFITEKMNQTGAIFGGESSGHYFFKATGNAESQLPVILTVLNVMTREDRPLSSIIEGLMRSFESGEYNFETDNAPKIIEIIKEKYNDGNMSTMDGVSIEYDNWRFGVRSSNTEPLLRLNVEAVTKDVMESKRDELIDLISKSGAKLAVGH
jgi:phosphomannomutase